MLSLSPDIELKGEQNAILIEMILRINKIGAIYRMFTMFEGTFLGHTIFFNPPMRYPPPLFLLLK